MRALDLPPIDLNQRYEIPEVCAYLRMGRSNIYKRIQDKLIRVIRDGARVYVSGAELARLATDGMDQAA